MTLARVMSVNCLTNVDGAVDQFFRFLVFRQQSHFAVLQLRLEIHNFTSFVGHFLGQAVNSVKYGVNSQLDAKKSFIEPKN